MTTTIQSTADWLALPEIAFPVLKSTNDSGVRYTVHKVGFLAVDEKECQRAGIAAQPGPAGKRLLPTAMIEFSNTRALTRLPVELSDWAFECVSAAHAGRLRLPGMVEFGELAGRKHAEFVVAKGNTA
jgi:hypothetical protein